MGGGQPADEDGDDGDRVAAAKVVEPGEDEFEGMFVAVVEFTCEGIFFAKHFDEGIHDRLFGGEDAVGGGVVLAGEGDRVVSPVMIGAEDDEEVGGFDHVGGAFPDLGVDFTPAGVVNMGGEEAETPRRIGISVRGFEVVLEEMMEFGRVGRVGVSRGNRGAGGGGAVFVDELLSGLGGVVIVEQAHFIKRVEEIIQNVCAELDFKMGFDLIENGFFVPCAITEKEQGQERIREKHEVFFEPERVTEQKIMLSLVEKGFGLEGTEFGVGINC